MEDCEKTISEHGTRIVYTRDGQFVAKCRKTDNSEYWYNADDKYRSDDGSAMIYYENGQIIKECWYHDGKLHRDDGPAMLWYKNGQKTDECWYRNGKYHRDDGPAMILYRDNQKIIESWYRNDRFGGNALAYVWLADINDHSLIYVPGRKNYTLDAFRDAVKGPLALELMCPLPIPIRKTIYEHYCLQ